MSSSRHIILKLSKVNNKEIILKEVREKRIWGTSIRLSAEFFQQNLYRSGETLEWYTQSIESIRRERKKKPLSQEYTAKLYFRYEGEIKVFLEEQKLREFIFAINRSALWEIMKVALLSEMEREKTTQNFE